MNYWQIILNEVEHYEDRGFRCLFKPLGDRYFCRKNRGGLRL